MISQANYNYTAGQIWLGVEEVALAVGHKIGHSSIKSAARMNRAVVLFLAKVEQVNMLVETGITVGGQFVQVHMVLNNRAEEFNYRFIVQVDDFDYTLFASSSALKCFNCNEEGHLVRACPSHVVPDAPAAEPTGTGRGAGGTTGAGAAGSARRGDGGSVQREAPLPRTERQRSRRWRRSGTSVCVRLR
ncbi:hypothetical protein D4764_12G0009970 [Takifugu flavidus]|uniref:CCHC-type domain-containing protein n=1 Tax=Takifugu flavidus TaxID=433684 RepID=A0A5C6PGT9_9TELE|nr:hypothetical protein D4764_12G0009970 [Takifugu flavidus]